MIKTLVTFFEYLDYLKEFRLQKREFGYKNGKPGLENQKIIKNDLVSESGLLKSADS